MSEDLERKVVRALNVNARRSYREIAEVLGVEPPASPKGAPGAQAAMPREHLLHGGFTQKENIVLIVRTGELPPLPASYCTLCKTLLVCKMRRYYNYSSWNWCGDKVRSYTW